MKRIIVCGGRRFADKEMMRWVLTAHRYYVGPFVLVHGGAPGADSLAQQLCDELGIQAEVFPAAWHSEGRRAGPIRNQRMVDAGADLVLAFPGGAGTADCVRRAEGAGIPVLGGRRGTSV